MLEMSAWSQISPAAHLAWEYQPLSCLYPVYSRSERDDPIATLEQSDTRPIAKLTYLFEV